MPLAHVPSHKHQDGAEGRQRHMKCQGRSQQHHQQQAEGVDHACHGAGGAVVHIRHGAGNRAGGGHAAHKRHGHVGNALRHQFLVGVMSVVNKFVRHPRTQQRLDRAQQRQGDAGQQNGLQLVQIKRRPSPCRQAVRYTAKTVAQGVYRQAHAHRGKRAEYQHQQRAWHHTQTLGPNFGQDLGQHALPQYQQPQTCQG